MFKFSRPKTFQNLFSFFRLLTPSALFISLMVGIVPAANAAVGITELTASNWLSNTGNALTTSTLYNSRTGWNSVITSSQDDSNAQVTFPAGFTTTFNGTSYGSVFVGSNTYLTFGNGSRSAHL